MDKITNLDPEVEVEGEKTATVLDVENIIEKEEVKEEVIMAVEEELAAPITKEEIKDVLDSIKINPKEKKEKKDNKTKKDTIDSVDDLYKEFTGFLENNVDITPDSGLKETMTTGIDTLDAILGGGFAIGAMNIVVGQPGSGKCLDYNEPVEIYEDSEVYTGYIKKKMKIGLVFDKYAITPDILNEIVPTRRPIYVKGKSGTIIRLLGVIKKSNCKMLSAAFSNGIKLGCASTHLLETKNNKFEKVEDIKIGKKVGDIELTEITTVEESGFAYDIAMEKEHIYTTPNGLVHHNTMLAIQAMGAGQKSYKGKMLSAFLDSEEATTTIRLSNLGVRLPKIKPYTDITVEKVFKFLEGLCLFKEEKGIIDQPSVIIWDSIANTLSQKEREVEDINSVIGYKARLLSILIPKYVAKCAKYNICFLAINQLRDVLNIGQFAAPKELRFLSTGKDMPGGTILRFNSFQLIELKTKSALSAEKGYGFDGFISSVHTVKNKLFAPNVTIELVGNFTTGFSNFWTNYKFLVDAKRMKAGAWNYLVTLPEKKFRTKDAIDLYKTDPIFKEAYDKEVTDGIQLDIIDKYNPDVEE